MKKYKLWKVLCTVFILTYCGPFLTHQILYKIYLVPRPHYVTAVNPFGSHGPGLFWICHQNQIMTKAWELGKYKYMNMSQTTLLFILSGRNNHFQ